MIRHEIFGKILSERKAKNILDIGAYYSPIHLFMSNESCPQSAVIVEPILEALSAYVPCTTDTSKHTHVIITPIKFTQYIAVMRVLPVSDSVVCIGCDSHYGPNRHMLETTFQRPYQLFIEYPSEYIHNAKFKKMMGEGPGEKMTFIHKFVASTNETQYTKRVMKIIEYAAI